MSGVRAGRWLALALAAAVFAAGCGVRPSGVVGAGAPVEGAGSAVQLYFVHRGELFPVARSGERRDPFAAIDQLISGPRGEELQAGITTEIPSTVSVRGLDPQSTPPVLTLNLPDGPLPELARRQVACTVRDGLQRGTDPFELRISGRGGEGGVTAVC